MYYKRNEFKVTNKRIVFRLFLVLIEYAALCFFFYITTKHAMEYYQEGNTTYAAFSTLGALLWGSMLFWMLKSPSQK